MLAAVTPLPVIGVPVPLKYLDGMDSLLSIVQMPAGVPVATVAVGNARNAGLLAVRILARQRRRAAAADGRLPGRARRGRAGQGRGRPRRRRGQSTDGSGSRAVTTTRWRLVGTAWHGRGASSATSPRTCPRPRWSRSAAGPGAGRGSSPSRGGAAAMTYGELRGRRDLDVLLHRHGPPAAPRPRPRARSATALRSWSSCRSPADAGRRPRGRGRRRARPACSAWRPCGPGCSPRCCAARELVASRRDRRGRPRCSRDFGAHRVYDPAHRLFAPALGGRRRPRPRRSASSPSPSAASGPRPGSPPPVRSTRTAPTRSVSLLLSYDDGRGGQPLPPRLQAATGCRATVVGTRGSIEIVAAVLPPDVGSCCGAPGRAGRRSSTAPALGRG